MPPPPPPPSTAAVETSGSQTLLSPLDLLTGAENANSSETAPSNGKKGKKGRSKSPKGKKNNNASAPTPFPEGSKISILKRDKSPTPPVEGIPVDPAIILPTGLPPPPSDPAILPILDPAIMPPIPSAAMDSDHLEATLTKVLAQEMGKQPLSAVDVSDDVKKAVEQALTEKLVPAVNKVMQESLSSFGRPLKASMEKLGQKGVSVRGDDIKNALDEKLEASLKAALADTMRTFFVPVMESMMSQVLQQVKQDLSPPPPDHTASLEALASQLSALNSKMDNMSKEIAVLKNSAPAAGMPNILPQPQTPNAVPQAEIIRQEINSLLQQRNYEAAFTKALSASTAEMAVYCCSRANLSDVMGENSPALSQPILLCLMQQLGAAMVVSSPSDVQTEVLWLQEIALTLNPADPNIKRHAPTVMQQLVASINQKMAEGNQQLRRPLHMLLQVIRGMQMG